MYKTYTREVYILRYEHHCMYLLQNAILLNQVLITQVT